MPQWPLDPAKGKVARAKSIYHSLRSWQRKWGGESEANSGDASRGCESWIRRLER